MRVTRVREGLVFTIGAFWVLGATNLAAQCVDPRQPQRGLAPHRLGPDLARLAPGE